jgi:hypothetical protein
MMVRGMTFTKYANGKGRPYLADVFFAQDEHKLFWCKSGTRQRTAKRSIGFQAITEIYQGKQTKAFSKVSARQALADRCCSIITAHRTLDLEASTRAGRDAFLYGIHTILFGKQANALVNDDHNLAREYAPLTVSHSTAKGSHSTETTLHNTSFLLGTRASSRISTRATAACGRSTRA